MQNIDAAAMETPNTTTIDNAAAMETPSKS
jgi:hypothetical protein